MPVRIIRNLVNRFWGGAGSGGRQAAAEREGSDSELEDEEDGGPEGELRDDVGVD